MTCQTCGTVNLAGAKFCSECGGRLLAGCPNCGATNTPGAKFCNDCGTRLEPVAGPAGTALVGPAAAGVASRPAATTERRLVTVLFADLVGFTSLAADRDAEAVRDLLSRYFEAAREVVERYGGTVEKFIGDAVMAVWGTPSLARPMQSGPSGPRSTCSLRSARSTAGPMAGASRPAPAS